MSKYKNNFMAKGIAYTALAFGSGSLLWFAAFLYAGSLSLWNFGLQSPAVLWMDASLCLVFFVQHSIMLRKGFRARLLTCIPHPYYGPFFAVSSGIALFILLLAWQQSPVMVFSAEGILRLAFRVLFLVSVAGFTWGTRALNAFDPFGAKTLLLHAANRQPRVLPLTIEGPYKFVRHPLYFFSLMMIWSSPDISADRLLFNLLWTAWIFLGTWLEEIDLVEDFGETYRDYQKSVPMLLPFKIFDKRR